MGRIYKCAVKGCRAAASSHQHSFPNPDILPERFQLWLDRIGNEDLQEVPKKTLYRTYRVCQLHFRPEYISRNNRLLRSAVPSENLHATTSQSADMDVSEYVEPSTSQSVEPSTSQATTDPSTETELQGNEASLQAAEKTFSTFMGNSKNFRHPVVSHFFRCQLRNAKKHPKGFRFTLDEKLMALALCKRSGKGYKLLSQLFALPSRKTLTTLLNKIPINPGINAMLFNHLQDTCKLLKEEQNTLGLYFLIISTD
ncbi:thap domain [Holotrichia oblita]|uniref:Thap domain n=1 Tax=Holotrichia oblita TaxID=644536 RepID=A0ACB9TW89_HOLOL|nr:thap domain [Holotrichia oblita]